MLEKPSPILQNSLVGDLTTTQKFLATSLLDEIKTSEKTVYDLADNRAHDEGEGMGWASPSPFSRCVWVISE